MSGGSLTFEAAVKTADCRGCMVVIPKANQLFIDIDKEEDKKAFRKHLKTLKKECPGLVLDVKNKPSSSKGHRHITIELSEDIEDGTRILLQAVLGSDRVRELLSYVRLRSGFRKHPTLFFEKRKK